MVQLIHESPAALYQRQQRKVWRERFKVAALVVAIAAVLVLLAMSGCAGGPSQQDTADLVRVGAVVDKACETLPAEDCQAGREALGRLGVSLADVQKTRIVAEAWDVARPILTAAIGWLLAGGA
jgi:hypothetical protein